MAPPKDLNYDEDATGPGFKTIYQHCYNIDLPDPVPEIAKNLYKNVMLTDFGKLCTAPTTIKAACIFAASREQMFIEISPICDELEVAIKDALQALWVVEHCALGIQSSNQFPYVQYESSTSEDTATYSIPSQLGKKGVYEPKKIRVYWFGLPVYTLMGRYNSTNPWLPDIHHRQTLSLDAALRSEPGQYAEILSVYTPTAVKVGPGPAYIGEKSSSEEYQSTLAASYAKAKACKEPGYGKEAGWTMVDPNDAAEKNEAWVDVTGNEAMTGKKEGTGLVASMKKLLK